MARSSVNGVYLGVTADMLVAVKRGVTGRARHIIRQEPISRVRLGWLDDEMAEMRCRYLHVSWPDGWWSLLATAWKRLIPDDADAIVGAMGSNARRLTELAAHRDAMGH